MFVDELIPALQQLNRTDKWRVMRFLVAELGEEEKKLSLPPGEYMVWSPLEAYSAAEALQAALEEARQEDAKSRAV